MYRSIEGPYAVRIVGGGTRHGESVVPGGFLPPTTWGGHHAEWLLQVHDRRTQPGGSNPAIAAAECIVCAVLAFTRLRLLEVAGLVLLRDVPPVKPSPSASAGHGSR